MELSVRLSKDLEHAILYGDEPKQQESGDSLNFVLRVPDRLLYGCDKCGYESDNFNNGQCPRCGEHHGEYHELD